MRYVFDFLNEAYSTQLFLLLELFSSLSLTVIDHNSMLLVVPMFKRTYTHYLTHTLQLHVVWHMGTQKEIVKHCAGNEYYCQPCHE